MMIDLGAFIGSLVGCSISFFVLSWAYTTKIDKLGGRIYILELGLTKMKSIIVAMQEKK